MTKPARPNFMAFNASEAEAKLIESAARELGTTKSNIMRIGSLEAARQALRADGDSDHHRSAGEADS